MIMPKRACLSGKLEKQALRFTSGSFAFCHLQLHDINFGFFFAFGAIYGKLEHHCIRIYLCPGFSIADRAMNPPGFDLFLVHDSYFLSVFTLRYSSGVY